MKYLLLISMIFMFVGLNAQKYETRYGKDGDTLNASSSKSTVFSVNSNNLQQAWVLTDIDSVAGTPGGVITITAGVDNKNFLDTIASVTHVSGVDTAFVNIDTTVNGSFIKWDYTTNATAQTSKYRVVIKSVNK